MRVVAPIHLSVRQEKILEIVKQKGPITSEEIAGRLQVGRATLRPDLAILTMSGLLEARPRVGYFYSGKSPSILIAEELRRLRVKDFKSVPAVIQLQAAVYDAIVAMFVRDAGTLFVVGEDAVLEGVVSRKDLLKATIGQTDIHHLPVSVIMTRMPNIITTTPEETVYMAAHKLIEHEIDSLPVVRTLVGEQGREKLEVIGRFTKTNLTKLMVELGEV